MTDRWKPLVGPAITILVTLATVFMWVGSLSKDVEALKSTANQSEGDHDVIIGMSKDIEYIKQTLTRIENQIGSKSKEAKR